MTKMYTSLLTLVFTAMLLAGRTQAQAPRDDDWGEDEQEPDGEVERPRSTSPSERAGLDEEGSNTADEGNEWGPPPGEMEDDERSLDARLNTLDRYLKDVQGAQRRYFTSWLVLSSSLIAGSTYLGLQEDTPGIRAGWFTSVALSSASLGLLFIRKGPGLRMHSRFKKMPDDTIAEKKAKVEAGEKFLATMASKDKRATSYIAHLLGAGAAGASGIGLALFYDYNLKEGMRRLFGTLLVSELIILSRPVRSISYYERYSSSVVKDVAIAPWSDGKSYGLGLSGRF